MTGDGRTLYLAAYCLEQAEQRTFRLDRILAMRLEDDMENEGS